MTDTVTRLRAHRASSYMCQDCYGTVMDDAADEIEALLTAIRPFIDPVREVGRDNNGAPTVHIEAFVSELETLRALAIIMANPRRLS